MGSKGVMHPMGIEALWVRRDLTVIESLPQKSSGVSCTINYRNRREGRRKTVNPDVLFNIARSQLRIFTTIRAKEITDDIMPSYLRHVVIFVKPDFGNVKYRKLWGSQLCRTNLSPCHPSLRSHHTVTMTTNPSQLLQFFFHSKSFNADISGPPDSRIPISQSSKRDRIRWLIEKGTKNKRGRTAINDRNGHKDTSSAADGTW